MEAKPNTPATGLPNISGTPQVGETLTADTSDIDDEDGLTNVSYRYQWVAGGSNISEATGSSYLLTTSEQGQTIQVLVTFTDDADNEETLTSAATAAVATAPVPLTASFLAAPSSHDGDNSFTFELRFSEEVELSYATLRDDDAFSVTDGEVTGASRLDKPGNLRWQIIVEPGSDADVTIVLPPTTDCGAQGAICTGGGKKLSGRAELTVNGPEEQSQERQNTPATGDPAINGTPRVGETLTADTSPIDDKDGLENVSYSYQWTAGGSDIDGATGGPPEGPAYTLTSSEEGQTIRVRVSFTDDSDNQESLTSAETAAVAALPTLTATFPVSPYQSARHNGAGDRPQVIVAFSLPVASFEKTTPSVSLTGTTVSSVRRHEEDGLENAWIFFLDPDGNDDIVFRLVTGQPCDSGGICTGDGTTLSEGVQVTLPGPKEEGDDQPDQQEEQEPQSPPPAPTNLTATVNADGHIVLSWEAPDDDSVTGYQILRRRPTEGEASLLVHVADTQSTATTFTDADVTAGVKHVYRVKAINAAGLSDWSNYVNPTP